MAEAANPSPMARASGLLLAGWAVFAAGCGGGPADGDVRTHREPHRSGTGVRAEFRQEFRGGTWVHDGPARFWDEEGRLTHAGTYRGGLESGAWQEYAPDGSLGEGPYEAGQRSGEWTWYHPAREGLARIPAERGTYSDGLREGAWQRWDASGSPLPTVTWSAGERVR